MANTVKHTIPFGINVANNLTTNSTSVNAIGFSANSLGVTVDSILNTKNITSNVFQANNAAYLSIVANLISMNVLTGNLETLKLLTSNQISVNSISGNILSMGNITSNQIFVNTISGNIFNITTLSMNAIVANTITIGSNATAQTIVSNGGMYVLDSTIGGGPFRHMPVEVLLQKGQVTSGNNFFINCQAEVEAGLYKSMRLLLTGVFVSAPGSIISMGWSTTGSGADVIATANYSFGQIWQDGFGFGSGDDGVGNFSISNGFAFGIGLQSNTIIPGIADILLHDTSLTSAQKSWYSSYASGFIDGTGTEVPYINLSGGHIRTSMVMKGIAIRCSNGNFTDCWWTLMGRRHI